MRSANAATSAITGSARSRSPEPTSVRAAAAWARIRSLASPIRSYAWAASR